MQQEAFDKLYSVADRVRIANDPRINQDWDYLQASNNFRFMTTKPSNVGLDRGIYSSPFDAFTNYMNILGDFINREGWERFYWSARRWVVWPADDGLGGL